MPTDDAPYMDRGADAAAERGECCAWAGIEGPTGKAPAVDTGPPGSKVTVVVCCGNVWTRAAMVVETDSRWSIDERANERAS